MSKIQKMAVREILAFGKNMAALLPEDKLTVTQTETHAMVRMRVSDHHGYDVELSLFNEGNNIATVLSLFRRKDAKHNHLIDDWFHDAKSCVSVEDAIKQAQDLWNDFWNGPDQWFKNRQYWQSEWMH
ncbi:hypothetical protein [Burkholderia phage BCSR5]|nr:hypothetical protein [Burkholderia phage BCSR5]